MQGYIHTINRLPPASTFGGTIADDMRTGEYVAREVDHVLLGAKTGPYSAQDAMVIYDGSNPDATTFLDLPSSIQREMLSTALRVGGVLWHQNQDDITSGNSFFLVGTNMGIKPAPRMIQTISNPHFHTTIFPQYTQGQIVNRSKLQKIGTGDYHDDGQGEKNSTEVTDIDATSVEHQKIFCIRPNNAIFRGGFMDQYQYQGWYESNLYTLDTPLVDQQDVFTAEANMKQFHDVYDKASQYIRTVALVGNPDNRGFGISFIYDINDKQWKIRLAFMEKNDSHDNGSICESSGHSIIRKVVDDPMRILDMRPFARELAKSIHV